MASDKDIVTWDKRLGDQARRGWDNYVHKRIDLTIARVNSPLLIAGEFLYVESASDDEVAIAKIRLNRNTNDALDLEVGVEIQTVFTEIFLSNDALDGEWLDLIVGINFQYKKKVEGDGGGGELCGIPAGGLYLGSWQRDLPSGVATIIQLDTVMTGFVDGIEDVGNYWITPGVAGIYHIHGQVQLVACVANASYLLRLWANGATEWLATMLVRPTPGEMVIDFDILKPMNATDYIQLVVYHNDGVGNVD